jgi:hypothetical protein
MPIKFFTSVYFCCLLFLYSLALQAQEMPVKAGKILDLCYQFKLKTADSLLAVYTAEMKSGQEVELSLLKANVYWWKIITGINDKTTKNNYYEILAEAETQFKKEADKGYSHYYKGISLYGYLARMDGLNKNYFKAFFRINSCLKYLEKSFGAEAKYPFFFLSSGLYNYHMLVTSKQYPLLIPYLSLYPKGNREKGILFLEKAAAHGNKYLSTEAHYFLMKIYIDEKKHEEALKYANELLQRFPINPIFLFYQHKLMLMSGKSEQAASIVVTLMNTLAENKQTEQIQRLHFQRLIQEESKKYKQHPIAK